MGIRVKVGSFTQGTVSVTGVGFRPVAVIFLGNRLAADGTGAHASLCVGAHTAAARRAYAGDSYDAVAGTTKSYRGSYADGCYVLFDSNALTQLCKADLTSLDADGFTLSWSVNDGVARVVNYIALGGTDITGAGYAAIRETGSVGQTSQAHSWGFAPDAVLHFGAVNSSNLPPIAGAGSWFPRIGFWRRLPSAPHEQAAAAAQLQNASATYNSARVSRAGRAYVASSGNVYFHDGIYDAIDATNVTVTAAVPGGTTVLDAADLGLRGVRAKVGTFACATVTGLQTVTGVGFEPALVIIVSAGEPLKTTNAVSTDYGIICAGAAARDGGRFALWAGGKGGGESAASKTQQALDRAALVKFYTPGGSAPTLQAAADIAGMTGDGFKLNWSTADGVARDCIYLALGQQPGRRGGLAHAGGL